MDLKVEREQEDDDRWLAEVSELPGVLAYGASADEAMTKAEALAFRVLSERLEQNESRPLAILFPGQDIERSDCARRDDR